MTDENVFEIYNDTLFEIPPFGLCEPSGGFQVGGALKVVRPTTDNSEKAVVNGPFTIVAGGTGLASMRTWHAVAFDQSLGTPAHGDTLGTVTGSFLAKLNNTGFQVMGGVGAGVASARRVVQVPTVATSAWKDPVRIATTAPVVLGFSIIAGGLVDGVTLAAGDRVLVKDQAAPLENGIYTVAASGGPTRATDADTGAELLGATVAVCEGTVNSDSVWLCNANATIVPGTTALNWTPLNSAVIETTIGGYIMNAATTGSWQTTGPTFSLPAPGTYYCKVRLTGWLTISAHVSGLIHGFLLARIWDVTNGAVVPNTAVSAGEAIIDNEASVRTVEITFPVTVAGATTYRLEGYLVAAGGVTYSPSACGFNLSSALIPISLPVFQYDRRR